MNTLKTKVKVLVDMYPDNKDYKSVYNSLNTATCKLDNELDIIEQYLKDEYEKYNLQW